MMDANNLTERQIRFLKRHAQDWKDREFGEFPHSFEFCANTLRSLEKQGVPFYLFHESMKVALDRKEVPVDEKWTYFCGVAKKKAKMQRPFFEVIDELLAAESQREDGEDLDDSNQP